MTSTPKYPGYFIVPWYNSNEWQEVYKLVFDVDANKENQRMAMEKIMDWQKRSTLLPSGIEGTVCILEAMLIDSKELSVRQYQMLLCSCIMRFMNTCVASRAAINNFTKTALNYDIPDWIINIRHDFAHGPNLPEIAILEMAIKTLFQWLKRTYWDPESKIIADNIVGEHFSNAEDCNSVFAPGLFELYLSLFVYDAKGLCYDEFIQEKLENLHLENIPVNDLSKQLFEKLKQISGTLIAEEWKTGINEMMSTYWFIINPIEIYKSKEKTKLYLFAHFKALLNLIQERNQVHNLLKELLFIVNDESEVKQTRLYSAQWMDVILQETKGFCKKTVQHSLKKAILEQISLLQLAVFKTNDYLKKIFFTSYMDLIKGKSLETAFNAKAVSTIDTTENLQELANHDVIFTNIPYSNSSIANQKCSQTIAPKETCNKKVKLNNIPTQGNGSLWSIVEDTSIFERCAIGIVPRELTT